MQVNFRTFSYVEKSFYQADTPEPVACSFEHRSNRPTDFIQSVDVLWPAAWSFLTKGVALRSFFNCFIYTNHPIIRAFQATNKPESLPTVWMTEVQVPAGRPYLPDRIHSDTAAHPSSCLVATMNYIRGDKQAEEWSWPLASIYYRCSERM